MPQAPTPFLGPSYIARSQFLADQTAINVYAESAEAKTGRAVAAFYQRPGLKLSGLPPASGPIRGLHAQEGGLFYVAGSAVYFATLANGVWTSTQIGTIGTQTGPIYWLDNGTQVALTDGVNGWILANQSFTMLNGNTAFSGGLNYASGDVIYLVAAASNPANPFATQLAAAAVQVNSVSGPGAVLTFTIIDPGAFAGGGALLANTVLNMASSTGSGAGFSITAPVFTGPKTCEGPVLSITGGTGYKVGDISVMQQTPTGVAQWASLNVQVTAINPGGVVTAVSIVLGGVFAGNPHQPFTQASTSGSGTGLQLSSFTAIVPARLYPLQLPFTGPGPTLYQDGFGLIIQEASDVLWQSNLFDLSIWQPLNFASVESKPSDLVTGWNLHEQLYLFKEDNAEVWVNAGLNGFSFQKLQGVFIEMGAAAPASIALCGESLCWLSRNDQGVGIVCRIVEYAPERISTHAIEFAIAEMSLIEDAIGFSMQIEGHLFYVLTFPSGNQTWVIDLTESAALRTPMWYQWTFFANGVRSRWRVNAFVQFQGDLLAGDYANGQIYSLDLDTVTDVGFPIERERSWRALSQPLFTPARFDSLQIDVQTGSVTPSGVQLTGASIAGGGAGQNYAVGDLVSMSATGAVTTAQNTIVVITAVNAGAVTAFGIVQAGYYQGTPAQLAATTLVKRMTPGNGSGLVLNALVFGPAQVLNPQGALTWSNDGGFTWTGEMYASLGLPGEYGKRVHYNRLGTTRRGQGMDRMFKFRCTDPVQIAWLGAYLGI